MSGCAVVAVVQPIQSCMGDHRSRCRRADPPGGAYEPRYSERSELEGSMEASCNNEDAPEEQHEIPNAKQSQPRLIC